MKISQKLFSNLALPVAALLITIVLAIFLLNTIYSNMKKTIKDEAFESIQLVLNADRDMYQAILAKRSMAFEINDNLIKDYNENVNQAFERTEKANKIFSDNQNFWKNVTEIKTNTNVFSNYIEFKKLFSDWNNISKKRISENNMVFSEMLKEDELFEKARENINVIGELIQQGAEISSLDNKKLTFSSEIIMIAFFIIISSIVFGIGFKTVKSIINPINKITKNLDENSKNLDIGSKNLESASYQTSSASQELSSAASELASNIEEITSSLEELQSVVESNTKNINQSEFMMKDTMAGSREVTNKMVEMQKALAEINDNSKKVVKIIKVIDDIAFQTNILSLNAAVEAARAGDAGRGFAVVADQVKNLAQKSSEAARETAELIEKAMDSVTGGESLGKIVMDVQLNAGEMAEKVAVLLDEVNRASKEQMKGINQITQAVSQTNTVVQQTASSAEEIAASGEELLGQASDLLNQASNMTDVVSELNFLVDGKVVEDKSKSNLNESDSQKKQIPLKKALNLQQNKIIQEQKNNIEKIPLITQDFSEF